MPGSPGSAGSDAGAGSRSGGRFVRRRAAVEEPAAAETVTEVLVPVAVVEMTVALGGLRPPRRRYRRRDLEAFMEELARGKSLLLVSRRRQVACPRTTWSARVLIRRVFHTLKGSGCLVGAQSLGSSAARSRTCSTACLDGCVARPSSRRPARKIDQGAAAINAALARTGSGQADLGGCRNEAIAWAPAKKRRHRPSRPSSLISTPSKKPKKVEATPRGAFEPETEGTLGPVSTARRAIIWKPKSVRTWKPWASGRAQAKVTATPRQ